MDRSAKPHPFSCRRRSQDAPQTTKEAEKRRAGRTICRETTTDTLLHRIIGLIPCADLLAALEGVGEVRKPVDRVGLGVLAFLEDASLILENLAVLVLIG